MSVLPFVAMRNTVNMLNRQCHRHSTDVWAPSWLNGNEIWQRPCYEMPTFMPIHKWQTLHRATRMGLCILSCSPFVLRAMALRFAAILSARPVCVRFYASLDSWCLVFDILAIFLSVFCCVSAVFMPFLRSSSFANPLLFDKSAFYLTVNHYHSEGRREAEGKQNGLMTYSQPSGVLPLL